MCDIPNRSSLLCVCYVTLLLFFRWLCQGWDPKCLSRRHLSVSNLFFRYRGECWRVFFHFSTTFKTQLHLLLRNSKTQQQTKMLLSSTPFANLPKSEFFLAKPVPVSLFLACFTLLFCPSTRHACFSFIKKYLLHPSRFYD